MKLKFKLVLFLLIISQLIFFAVKAEGNKIYLIPLNYNKGIISFGEITTKLGYVPPSANDQAADKSRQYQIEVISFSQQILESKVFSFSLTVMPAPPLSGEKFFKDSPATLDEATELIILPYHKDGQELKVYDSNKKLILSKDIAYLSDVCGDGICQAHESNVDCAKDCPPAGKDDYCNLEYKAADPDCANFPAGQTNTENKNNTKIYIFAISIIAVLLLSTFVFIWIRRRNSNNA